jgi:hypothetical protein
MHIVKTVSRSSGTCRAGYGGDLFRVHL